MRRSTRRPASCRALIAAALAAALAPAAVAQTDVHNTGASGNWTSVATWQAGTVPNNNGPTLYNAVIDAGGSYTILLDSTSTPAGVTVSNLTLNSGGAVLGIDSGATLNVVGNATLTAGVVNVQNGGTISGGTFSSGGGSLQFNSNNSNTLNGVTLGAGVLNLAPNNSVVQFTGGTSLAAGAYALGSNSALVVKQGTNNTFNGHTFNLSTGATLAVDGTNNTLTLGATTAVSVAASVQPVFVSLDLRGTGNSIVNQGTLGFAAGSGSRTFGVTGTGNFSNAGGFTADQDNSSISINNVGNVSNSSTLKASGNNATVTVNNTGAFTNTGTVEADAGATVFVSSGANTWDNSGGTFVVNGGTLNLGGTFTPANIGTISRTGGTVQVSGTLNNTTLALTAATGSFQLAGGRVNGGTVTAAGGATLQATGSISNALNNVSLAAGVLDLTPANSVVQIQGSTVLPNSAPVVLGNNSAVYFNQGTNQTTTLSGYTFQLTGVSGSSSLAFEGAGNGYVLASNTTVTVPGGATGFLSTNLLANNNATLTNAGTIQVAVNGASAGGSAIVSLNNTGTAFTNTGTLSALADSSSVVIGGTGDVSNSGTIQATGLGGSVSIQPAGAFTNQPGGKVIAQNGSTASIGSGSTVWNNLGQFVVNGGALELGGAFTTVNIGTIVRSGASAVRVTGALDNTGAILALADTGTNPYGSFQLAGGGITGGTVTAAGTARLLADSNSGNVLNNVSFGANVLDLAPANSVVRLKGTTALPNSVPVNLGSGSGVIFEQTATLSGYTVNTVGSGGTFLAADGAGNTVTLAPATTVVVGGTDDDYASFYSGYSLGGATPTTLVNQGTIRLAAGVNRGALNFFTSVNADNAFVNGATGQILAAPDNSSIVLAGSGPVTNAGTVRAGGVNGNLTVQNSSNFMNSGALQVTGANGTLAINSLTAFTNTPTGLIEVNGPGATGTIDVVPGNAAPFNTFTNNGTLRAAGGATLTVTDTGSFTNFSGTTLTGGTYDVQAGSTLDLGSRAVTVLAPGTSVSLTGAGSNFAAVNTVTTVNGSLTVQGGRSFTPVNGTVTVGGTLTVGTAPGDTSSFGVGVTVAAGGKLQGYGTVTGPVTVNAGGAIKGGASIGTQTVTNGVTLNGAAGGTGAALVVDGSPTANGVIASGNTLNFANVSPATPFNLTVQAPGLDLSQTYNWTVATAANGFQLNGSPLAPNFVIPANDYVLNTPGYQFFDKALLQVNGTGNALTLSFQPVPEPATVLLTCAGATGAVAAVRRRRRVQG